jgi:hypothetical protein
MRPESQALARYTVELIRPAEGWANLERTVAFAREAAAELRDRGTPVRLLRSIFVPEDDACFFLYEGPSAESVRAAVEAAALAGAHVQECAVVPPPISVTQPPTKGIS